MGEFTTRFDAEILKSKFAELEAERQKEQQAKAARDKVDEMIDEIEGVLTKRASFIDERFKNAVRGDLDEGKKGFLFNFCTAGELKSARFSMQARINESRMAIIVESRFEVPSMNKQQYDYVTLPTSQPNTDRARRFIESKLFDFAREYMAL